jgi:polar amino acid transport system substrate-binding protein
MILRSKTGSGVLILLLILGTGAGTASAELDGNIQTANELAEYVTQAGRYLTETGIDTGLDAITTGTAPPLRSGIPLLVYDQNGTLLASPNPGDDIGKNMIHMTDPYGMEIIRLEKDIAANESGFFLFMESFTPGAATHEINTSDYQPRVGYVHPVTDQIWITADVSFQDLKDPETGIPYMTGMEEFVSGAAAYAREVGREEANSEFNDLNGSFTHGSKYIYAFDMDGTFLASPYYPESIGTNQMDVVRTYGVASVADAIRIAKEKGSGYLAFVILNPDTNRPEPKLGYVEKVDDSWLVGSGLYGSDLVPPDE